MIEPGDQVPGLSITVRNSVGSPDDAGAVSLTITLPGDTVVSPAVSHDGIGAYSATYTAVQSGTHTVEWDVTGANAGTFRDTFYVEPNFSIVSLAEVKTHLRIVRSADDETLRLIALMASDACESPEGTNRRWRKRTITAEKHTCDDVFRLHNYPIVSVTRIQNGNDLVDETSYDVNLDTGWVYANDGALYNDRRYQIAVSYVAGAPTVPPLVRNGVLEMCRHLYSMHRGGANLPSQDEPDYTTSLAYLVPNRVAYAWQAYRMPG